MPFELLQINFSNKNYANLKNTQGMLDWSYSQLSDSNKQFVKEHPDPPIMRWLDQFYGKKA